MTNPITQSVRDHKRRCIAAFIHENTKAGKRTNAHDVARAYGWDRTEVHTLIKNMLEIRQPTAYGVVKVIETGKHVSDTGWQAMTYAAILSHEKTTNQ
jgi:hypothetical protein